MEDKKVNKKQHVLKRILKKIPDNKTYIEFITALLSIPVLLTVILLNFNSLRTPKTDNTTTPTPQTVVVTVPDSGKPQTIVTQEEECIPEIGPIEITSPEEGEVVTDNPLFVSIRYEQDEFCSVVWSYRINGGKWSEYDDRSIALYNPPPGAIKFELRIKSVVGTDTEILTKNFSYTGTEIVSDIATNSAQTN